MAEKPTPNPQVLDPSSADAKGKANLFDEMMSDPEMRTGALRFLNKKHPDVYLPEVAVVDKMNDGFAAINKRLDDEKTEREQRELSERLAGEKRDATKGLDDEGVKSLEKLMVDNKIGSYGAARELYNLRVKVATPTNLPHRVRGGMPANLKDISANPGKWAREQAFAAVDELAARREAAERV